MPIPVKTLLNQAHILCGDISDAESLAGNPANQSLFQLNQLVQQLNTQRLFPFSRIVLDFAPSSSKQVYTIGTTYTDNGTPVVPDIESTRPAYIERMLYLTTTSSAPQDVVQLELTDVLMRRISPTAIGLPSCFGMNQTYPHSTIYLDVAPQAGSHLLITYSKAIPDVTLADTMDIPPEYSRLLICGVARMAAIRQQMPVEIVTNMDLLYKEAYNTVVTSNSRIVTPVLEGGLRNNSAYVYNAIGGF